MNPIIKSVIASFGFKATFMILKVPYCRKFIIK